MTRIETTRASRSQPGTKWISPQKAELEQSSCDGMPIQRFIQTWTSIRSAAYLLHLDKQLRTTKPYEVQGARKRVLRFEAVFCVSVAR